LVEISQGNVLGSSIEESEITDGSVTWAKTSGDIPGTWELLETLTFSADTTQTSGALTAFKEYAVVIKDFVCAVATDLYIRVNGDSGANYETLWSAGTVFTYTAGATEFIIQLMDTNALTNGMVTLEGKTGSTAGGQLALRTYIQGRSTYVCWYGYWFGGNATQLSTITLFGTQNFTGTAQIWGRN